MEQRVDYIETWLKWLLRGFGVTLVGLLAFAFWLGTISNEVSRSQELTTKIYSAVLEHPESLMVRTKVIEHRLGEIDNRLSKVETRLDAIDERLDLMDKKLNKLDDMNSKLDSLVSRFKVRR